MSGLDSLHTLLEKHNKAKGQRDFARFTALLKNLTVLDDIIQKKNNAQEAHEKKLVQDRLKALGKFPGVPKGTSTKEGHDLLTKYERARIEAAKMNVAESTTRTILLRSCESLAASLLKYKFPLSKDIAHEVMILNKTVMFISNVIKSDKVEHKDIAEFTLLAKDINKLVKSSSTSANRKYIWGITLYATGTAMLPFIAVGALLATIFLATSIALPVFLPLTIVLILGASALWAYRKPISQGIHNTTHKGTVPHSSAKWLHDQVGTFFKNHKKSARTAKEHVVKPKSRKK